MLVGSRKNSGVQERSLGAGGRSTRTTMELKAMGQGEGERAQGHGELVAGIGAGICQTPQPMGALSTPSVSAGNRGVGV